MATNSWGNPIGFLGHHPHALRREGGLKKASEQHRSCACGGKVWENPAMKTKRFVDAFGDKVGIRLDIESEIYRRYCFIKIVFHVSTLRISFRSVVNSQVAPGQSDPADRGVEKRQPRKQTAGNSKFINTVDVVPFPRGIFFASMQFSGVFFVYIASYSNQTNHVIMTHCRLEDEIHLKSLKWFI